MFVVAVDPQFPMRKIGIVLDIWSTRLDQQLRGRRIVGGDEPYLVRRVVTGRNEDQAIVGRPRNADGKGNVVRLLVKGNGLGRVVPDAMVLSPVRSPLIVDL